MGATLAYVFLISSFKQGNLYIAEEDIKSIPCFSDETLVAVRAPHGTTLEVPDPDEGMEYPKKRYQIFLKSTSGPVEVFLVSLNEKLEEQAEKAAEPSCVLPSSKVTSNLDSKPEAFEVDPAEVVMNRGAAHAHNSVVSSVMASTDALKHEPRTTIAPPLEHVPTGAGAHPSASGGDGNVNSPAILRIMPPSCDPDYWFSSDEVKEYGIGLNDMFAPAGVDGELLLFS